MSVPDLDEINKRAEDLSERIKRLHEHTRDITDIMIKQLFIACFDNFLKSVDNLIKMQEIMEGFK
jgi:hypothetical protein